MPPVHSKADALRQLARSRKLLRSRDLDDAGIPRAYLRRLCDCGELERVGRGLYRVPGGPITALHSLAEVAGRVPHATACLLTALQAHELTTEVPHSVWILIDRKARAPKLEYPTLEIVRASGAALTHGVERRMIDGVEVRITSAAKTVADCFRYRQRVGLEVAISALRDYLRTRRGSVDALVQAARIDHVEKIVRPYLEALA